MPTRALPPDLAPAVFAEAQVPFIRNALGEPRLRQVATQPSVLAAALSKLGIWVDEVAAREDLKRQARWLRRRLIGESNWQDATAAVDAQRAVRYHLYPTPSRPHALDLPPAQAALGDDGESYACYSPHDHRATLVHLNYGVTKPPAFVLPQRSKPTALAYAEGGQRLFVASRAGEVMGYRVLASGDNEPPQPLGNLWTSHRAAPEPCYALWSPPSKSALLGLSLDGLCVWSLGQEHEGYAYWQGATASGVHQHPNGNARYLWLVGAPNGEAVLTADSLGAASLHALTPSQSISLGPVGPNASNEATWRQQSLAFDATSRLCAYVHNKCALLYDLRASRQREVGALRDPNLRATVVAPVASRDATWLLGTHGNSMHAWDLRHSGPSPAPELMRTRYGGEVTWVQYGAHGAHAAFLRELDGHRSEVHSCSLVQSDANGGRDALNTPYFAANQNLRGLASVPHSDRFFCQADQDVVIFSAVPSEMKAPYFDDLKRYVVGLAGNGR